ncbi:hypothetical protein Pcinc_011721 [Petrolisthes cinctipes]|uniref:Fe2OG dioxygenase domain-containing protein n=1 Tax=Petrolisthes cinctipes TaxID=88211 RepID=A0AAE1G0G5_PETCI|nr:hypothetical protein Pcinc_011721 [Petrolisthes cinctipes]
MISYKEYRVENAPCTAYYIPEFITKEEEQKVTQQVYSAPKPKWKELAHRRLQNWGGFPHPKGMVTEAIPIWLQQQMDHITDLGAFGDKIPNHVLVNEYLAGQGIMPHVDGPIFYPTITTISLGSHTLLDLYLPLQPDLESSQTHTCNTDQVQSTPLTHPEQKGQSTSCPEFGSSLLSESYVGSLLLEPRSLLILQGDLYTSYLHGIGEVKEDVVTEKIFNRRSHQLGDVLTRSTRISLTIRHVPKVFKSKLIFGKVR